MVGPVVVWRKGKAPGPYKGQRAPGAALPQNCHQRDSIEVKGSWQQNLGNHFGNQP